VLGEEMNGTVAMFEWAFWTINVTNANVSQLFITFNETNNNGNVGKAQIEINF
jgi:hypothetical protein